MSLLDQRADLAPTAVLDFETTGLHSADGDRVIEVAVIRTEAGRERASFQSLVDPQRDIPPESFAVHGITAEMLAGQPHFEAISGRLLSLIEGAVFVAHNAPFDLGFLRVEMNRLGIQVAPVAVCTLAMARNLLGLPRCNLGAVCQRTGVSLVHGHRAMADARATLGIYRAMLDSLPAPLTVRELLAKVSALGQAGPERVAITHAVEEAARTGRPLTIDYTSRHDDSGALTTRRAITITRLRLPYIDAWCHLRQAERVFRVERIQRVLPDRVLPDE